MRRFHPAGQCYRCPGRRWRQWRRWRYSRQGQQGREQVHGRHQRSRRGCRGRRRCQHAQRADDQGSSGPSDPAPPIHRHAHAVGGLRRLVLPAGRWTVGSGASRCLGLYATDDGGGQSQSTQSARRRWYPSVGITSHCGVVR